MLYLLRNKDNTMHRSTRQVIQLAKERRELINRMDKASAALAAFCAPHRNSTGLIPEVVRESDQYIKLSSAYYSAKTDMACFMAKHKGLEVKRAFAEETKQHYGRN